ncbi:hypothetical protein QJS10_CPA01g00436 [Acorus calamus]|uniref:Uncharacterized protein n=1 Tax=Acorus calamus TaxID=4465 RepID=A0AAV9FKQ6_ACOCL|nr:hypothetical protein QJS10_CPA01g00436 [Acorus calamus]
MGYLKVLEQAQYLENSMTDHTQQLQQQEMLSHNTFMAHFIQDGSWVKPLWWHVKWNEIWSTISEMECGGVPSPKRLNHSKSSLEKTSDLENDDGSLLPSLREH